MPNENRLNPATGQQPDNALQLIRVEGPRDIYSPPFRTLRGTQPDSGTFTENSRPSEAAPVPEK